ncbi:hypothetical protein CRV08_06640 [Halarcobacter ebronensis]|uniref:Uncharacterized protein n=1 Tax=Halarcobacter ebronensis TaxID=1462615 RepID=A0A4Q0YDH2_9BACT|nr:hypothetical protein [Halarcobacter ebronensis]RXJ68502.1 hypothetical protein CRV08_06640 [Halarcobacter ebronensis]
MGNEYNVIEAGTIICACGGKVTLTSSVPNLKIAGQKPLYLKDILGAPVACPRSKNPCTKVASISTAGTEVNVSATGLTYLLRTDGFKTDKGRAVILKDPGQGTSKISAIPSLENQDVIAEEKSEKKEYIKEEKEVKVKYKLYLIRKSQDIYKPIRPSRDFRKANETYLTNEKEADFDNIYSHTLAFVYVVKGGDYLEYKIYNDGGINAETLKDIYYHDTKNEVITKFIPLEEKSFYQIYYSNFQLKSLRDIQKLPELKIDTQSLDSKSGIYIKDIDSINKNKIEQKLLNAQKPKNEEKNSNIIVGFLEDSIGEIEDLYEEYYTNYKLAYSYNKKIFDDIKKNNSYAYTVSNLVDYFYISNSELSEYRANVTVLKDCYKRFIELLFFNKELYNYVLSFKDIENIVNKDTSKRAFSFHKVLENYKKDFFSYNHLFPSKRQNNKHLGFRFSKEYIKIPPYMRNKDTTSQFIVVGGDYFYHSNKSEKTLMEFTGSDDYTLVKEDAQEVLAHIVFSLFFLEEFEDELYKHIDKSKVIQIRNEFLIAYRKIIPLPKIGDSTQSNVKELIHAQSFYNQTVSKTKVQEKKTSHHHIIQKLTGKANNEFLNDYKQLDNMQIKKSFDFSYSVAFKSKLPYLQENIKYYKEDGVLSPNKILKTIQNKLESEDLKTLLKTYQTCSIEEFEYVISSMNIVLSLCSSKIPFDEELNVNGIFANDNIAFLYDFTNDLVDRKTKLSDTQKDLMIKEYQISQYFDEYLIKQLLNQLLFKTTKKDKANKFLNTYSKIPNPNPTSNQEEPLHVDQDIQTAKEQILETLKFVCGITDQMDKVLDEVLGDIESGKVSERIVISKSRALQIGLAFKTYSLFIAIANIEKFIYDDGQKELQSAVSLVNDLSTVSGTIVSILQKEKFENLAQNFINSMRKGIGKETIKINLANSEFLSALGKGFAKVSTYAVIIITVLDAIKYKKNEDYDALAATIGMFSVAVAALFIASGTPLVIFVAIASIAYALVMLRFIDSAFEAYLKRSLFYKNDENYPAKYLLESTNKNPKLKAINAIGFKSPKEIFNFIGSNYKTNETFFDTGLKNELSFLISAMYGYKLDKTDLKTDQFIRNMQGVQTNFRAHDGIKIPKLIYDDEKFELYFSPYGDEYIKIGKTSLFEANGYALFNLFPEDTTYYNLSTLNNKLKTTNQISYIIIKSSLIDFKYKIELSDLSKIPPYSDVIINSLEQVSFEPSDEQLIQGNTNDEDE